MDSQSSNTADNQPDRGVRPARRQLTTRRKLAFAAFTVVMFFSCIELLARLLLPSDEETLHQFHKSLITILGLPALNETMEFDPQLFWRLRENLRDVHIAGTIRDFHLDFTVSTHGHFRNPAPIGAKDRRRLLILGDSCAFGVGVNDDQTWPADLQRRCDDAKLDIEIINAGVPGYTAFQGRRFLEANIDSIRPDVVLACFGFNDSDSWASRSDLETARQVGRLSWDSALIWSRAYSQLKKSVVALRAPRAPTDSSGRSRLNPREFLDELETIRQLAAKHQASIAFVIWPYEDQVRAKSVIHESYQRLVVAYSRKTSTPCIDLLPAFINQQAPLFVDHVHANPSGCRTAAAGVFEALPTLVRD